MAGQPKRSPHATHSTRALGVVLICAFRGDSLSRAGAGAGAGELAARHALDGLPAAFVPNLGQWHRSGCASSTELDR